MNKELSNRVGAVMLTDPIQSLSKEEKMAFVLACEQAESFESLKGSPKKLLLEAEKSNAE